MDEELEAAKVEALISEGLNIQGLQGDRIWLYI